VKSYLLLLTALALAACAPKLETPEPGDEPKPNSRYIGQITSVHAEQGFVLIRRASAITLNPGTILLSEGPNGRAANLRISGENLGQMLAADVQSGSPQVGDSVREPLISEAEIEADEFESDPQVTDKQ